KTGSPTFGWIAPIGHSMQDFSQLTEGNLDRNPILPGALNLRQSRSTLALNTYRNSKMWGQLLRGAQRCRVGEVLGFTRDSLIHSSFSPASSCSGARSKSIRGKSATLSFTFSLWRSPFLSSSQSFKRGSKSEWIFSAALIAAAVGSASAFSTSL